MDTNEKLHQTVGLATETCTGFQEVQVESDQRTTLAYALAAVRATRRTLADIEKDLEKSIVAASDDMKFDVDQLGRVQILGNTKRTKWDKDAVVHEFARAYSKITSIPPDSVIDVIDQFRDCVSIGGAKKPFEEFTGHELGEFCQEKDNGKSVRIDEPESSPRLDGF